MITPDTLEKKLPFYLMADIELRLRILFSGITNTLPGDFPGRILNICNDLQRVCATDPDAALGMLVLGNETRYTITHPLYVAILCELIAQKNNIDAERRISILAAALTCNVAMIDLQDALQKQQAPLSEEQSAQIRQHPLKAADMLREAGVQDALWIDTVAHHHERLDGRGYPGILSGNDISIPVRIVSLADIYGAMISPRNYRAVKFSSQSLHDTFLKRGAVMDDSLPQIFLQELGVFPPGTFVSLHNGEIAIVTRRGPHPMTPQVCSVVSHKGLPLPQPVVRDSSQEIYSIRDFALPSRSLAIKPSLLWG